MANKVTPLYAQTRILLNLWALDDRTPVAKKHFFPGKAYTSALNQLEEEGAVEAKKFGSYSRYAITESGEGQLAAGLKNDKFTFSTSIGSKTTNAILQWLRQNSGAQTTHTPTASSSNIESKDHSRNGHSNGSVPEISSYEAFAETTLETYDRLNQDYNLDNLVPIYRIRRELGDRLPRKKFNEWLLEIQANDLVQLMASDQAQVTSDQMEDSITIPGAGTRFFIKRLK